MAFDMNLLEKILTVETFSPDFLLPRSGSTDLLLFKDVEEWYTVASLLISDGQVSMICYLNRQK